MSDLVKNFIKLNTKKNTKNNLVYSENFQELPAKYNQLCFINKIK